MYFEDEVTYFDKIVKHKNSSAQQHHGTFTKPCLIENSESYKLLKTFIFMSTVVILFVVRFFVADPMLICLTLNLKHYVCHIFLPSFSRIEYKMR